MSPSKALSSNNGLSCFALPSISTITIHNGVWYLTLAKVKVIESPPCTVHTLCNTFRVLTDIARIAFIYHPMQRPCLHRHVSSWPDSFYFPLSKLLAYCATSITVGLPNMLSNSRPQLNKDPWRILSCLTLIPHLPCTVSVCSTWLFIKPRLRPFNSL